ncbi:hypothetical protein BD777DRAFT_125839 [Yarrowia lipolytica]|nr:hypothetical protein BD777DRAFT_125839 [Yarrowia lipolytica]
MIRFSEEWTFLVSVTARTYTRHASQSLCIILFHCFPSFSLLLHRLGPRRRFHAK